MAIPGYHSSVGSANQAMRKRARKSWAIFIVLTVAAVAGIVIVAIWARPASIPRANARLVGYLNSIPGLQAQVLIANQGSTSMSLDVIERYSGEALVATVRTDTLGEWTTFGTRTSVAGGTVIRPGLDQTVVISLPPNTERWQIRFRVRTTSLRERTLGWMGRSRWGKKLYPISRLLIGLLSDQPGKWIEIKSDVFDVPQGPGGTSNKPSSQLADTNQTPSEGLKGRP